MPQRSFSQNPLRTEPTTGFSLICISTLDKSVRESAKQAFRDACDIQFFSSSDELSRAVEPLIYSPTVILIDLDAEFGKGKIANTSYLKFPIETPLVLLASEIETDVCREYFRTGVDDILLKPLNLSELTVKTERAVASTQLTIRNYLKFLSSLGAELTITELRILSHFFEQPARIANRKSLTEHIWSQERVHPKALDVHLFNLRSKIAKAKMKIDYEPEFKGWRLKTQGH